MKSARTCPPSASVYAPHSMNRVPYNMLLKSKIHEVGAFRMYRLNTSTETTNVNARISQAKAFPHHTLTSSMARTKRGVFIVARGCPGSPGGLGSGAGAG